MLQWRGWRGRLALLEACCEVRGGWHRRVVDAHLAVDIRFHVLHNRADTAQLVNVAVTATGRAGLMHLVEPLSGDAPALVGAGEIDRVPLVAYLAVVLRGVPFDLRPWPLFATDGAMIEDGAALAVAIAVPADRALTEERAGRDGARRRG